MHPAIRIVLIDTTHPGNIGAAARALKNMSLHDLALVRPQSYPHVEATARASGAGEVLLQTSSQVELEELIVDATAARKIEDVRTAQPY